MTLTAELKHQVDVIRESQPFVRTSEIMKSARSKTANKWGVFKQSGTYKTMEDKANSAYSSLRSMVYGSGPDSLRPHPPQARSHDDASFMSEQDLLGEEAFTDKKHSNTS
ncbi:hypothetical protein Ciccas_011595 [Cichlidogyrus casuarinus]|uniref:Uncharacterized protein n=1 Tax=Cichlidogyrus casuarinus TaxID=1844966 RepID=A0ABD2PTR2_9PLAT